MHASVVRLALCLALVFFAGGVVLGQGTGPYGQLNRIPLQSQIYPPGSMPRPTNTLNPTMQYFGGARSRVSQFRQTQRKMPLPRPVQVRGSGKPFSQLSRRPTISPYLNLDVRTSAVGLPNYYAFVRPQLQQQQANRAQAAQVHRLQQQLRIATATGVVSNNPSGGIPTTGHSSQFLNLGDYFPGAR